MAKEKNLRDKIIQQSMALFELQGYSATSVRQIAKRCGCTAGSLYYFFEGGKTEILQEVVRAYGLDPLDNLSWVIEEQSLEDLIDRLIAELPLFFQNVSKKLSWLMFDVGRLTENEMSMMRKFPLSLHKSILQGVRMHLDDPRKSLQVSWVIYCGFYGYIEVFKKIGLVVEEEFTIEEMGESIKTAVVALAGQEQMEAS